MSKATHAAAGAKAFAAVASPARTKNKPDLFAQKLTDESVGHFVVD
jgi:hypothetical protein